MMEFGIDVVMSQRIAVGWGWGGGVTQLTRKAADETAHQLGLGTGFVCMYMYYTIHTYW